MDNGVKMKGEMPVGGGGGKGKEIVGGKAGLPETREDCGRENAEYTRNSARRGNLLSLYEKRLLENYINKRNEKRARKLNAAKRRQQKFLRIKNRFARLKADGSLEIEGGMKESRVKLEWLRARGDPIATSIHQTGSPTGEGDTRRTVSLSEAAALGRVAHATAVSQERTDSATAHGMARGGTELLQSDDDDDDDDDNEDSEDDETDVPVDLSSFVDMVIPKYFDDVDKYYKVRANEQTRIYMFVYCLCVRI